MGEWNRDMNQSMRTQLKEEIEQLDMRLALEVARIESMFEERARLTELLARHGVAPTPKAQPRTVAQLRDRFENPPKPHPGEPTVH